MSETGDRIRVLHVDDEPTFAELVATRLERQDDRFDVVTEHDAGDALDRLSEDVDCIVSDYDMPGRNGIQFLEAVRSRSPDLPFILFTGKGSEELASEAISAGVTDYLQKGGGSDQYALLANRVRNAVDAARSKRALAERNRRLETLIGNLPGMVYRCRNEPDWPMEFVEGECETLTGYAADVIESGDVVWGDDVLHPDDRDRMWTAVQDGLAEDGSFEVRYRIVTSGGATKWMWERGQGLYDDGGDLEAIEGFITDVTNRREYERALAELHTVATEISGDETVEAVCERTIDAAETVLDLDLCVINLESDGRLPVVAISSGVPPDGATPMSVEEGLVGKTYRTGESFVVDDAADHPEANPQGDYRAGLSIPIGDHGVFQAVSDAPGAFDENDRALAELLVSHTAEALDRIERTEELRRQNERLEEFATIVSHDLRNPLTVADGHVDLALERCDDPDLETAARALDRAFALIEGLLTLARDGPESLTVEPVDLESVAAESWETVRTPNATLVVDGTRTVRADEARLRQLLENLFRNSIEHNAAGVPAPGTAAPHGADGAGDVTVTVEALPNGFAVSDDGVGAAGDDADELFTPGYSTSASGTGFGLPIVKRIADAHGWDVAVTDAGGGGFRVELTGVDAD
ncbi:response regulator [Halobaculum sp. D14]|uniref:receiver/sensor box histidine kinase n=1 Tax=Halobaculum sp. D14 TaxID=3421642 RepID=UPI003EBD1641